MITLGNDLLLNCGTQSTQTLVHSVRCNISNMVLDSYVYGSNILSSSSQFRWEIHASGHISWDQSVWCVVRTFTTDFGSWHLYTLMWNKWNWISHLALHKLMANAVLKKCCCKYDLIGQWSFSPGTAYPCKIFLSSRTNYNSVNGTLVNAQCYAARKWLLLLNKSWTDRTSQFC